jgi:hypothetical protein
MSQRIPKQADMPQTDVMGVASDTNKDNQFDILQTCLPDMTTSCLGLWCSICIAYPLLRRLPYGFKKSATMSWGSSIGYMCCTGLASLFTAAMIRYYDSGRSDSCANNKDPAPSQGIAKSTTPAAVRLFAKLSTGERKDVHLLPDTKLSILLRWIADQEGVPISAIEVTSGHPCVSLKNDLDPEISTIKSANLVGSLITVIRT